jgi:Ca2+-binding RTX toxin-like protein
MRRLKMSVLGLTVVALLACAPSAFASTLTKSGSAIAWTAASGIDNNTSFTDSNPTTIVINTSDDRVTYDSAGGTSNNVTPDGDCTDSDGTPMDASASQVTCTSTTGVTANSLDGNDNEDASGLNSHAITMNLGDNSGSGWYCCWGFNGDQAKGGAKNDTLNGEQGADFIQGGPGADTINGGDGNDVAFGGYAGGPTPGDGGDTMNGGPGQDELHGQNGDDQIDGGPGNDNGNGWSPYGGAGLDGGPGNDTISGGDGNDRAAGGPGDDTINGNAGDDQLTGDCGGYHNCNGSDGNDTVNGGGGDDSLQGDGGADQLNGDAGDDYMYDMNDAAPDVMHGGDGVDQVQYDTTSVCCGNSSNDQVTASLDGQANDGYHNLSGSSQPDDPNNNFGGNGDVEWVSIDTNNAPGTVTGSDGANVINLWGNSADTVDPGLGPDNVYTSDGNDTVNAVDGYPDTVDCGDGVDTANVDQFDQVIHCETVNRSAVASSYATAEDLPPTVSWVTPAQGKALTSAAKTPLEVTASDDHGVSKVDFYVGQRLVCSVNAAPYRCDYQPIGVDLGRNTLVAIATDTAGQTSTALNSVTVPRFVPMAITAKTTPKKDGNVPYAFRTSGRVLPPAGVSDAVGCSGGHVTVAFRAGKKTVSSRRVATKADCTYRSAVTFLIPARLHPSKLTVLVRFTGSSVLGPRSRKAYAVKVG